MLEQDSLLQYHAISSISLEDFQHSTQNLVNQKNVLDQKKSSLKDPIKIACCITVYNEPSDALLYSLAGLFHNIDYLINKNGSSTMDMTICIIFDGLEKISVSVIDLLKSLKLYEPKEKKSETHFHIFDAYLNRQSLNHEIINKSFQDSLDSTWKNIYKSALENQELVLKNDNDSVLCRTLLGFKEKNAGKLNSHWWFYNFLCPQLQPDYCIQMDVGTVPQANCIANLLSFMEQHPDMGAVGSNTQTTKPCYLWQIAHLWQFGYFNIEKFFFWPAEIFSGYLSVIPGQFSIHRWSALTAKRLNTHVSDELTISNWTTPLDTYFRGLGQLNLLEKIMFLAEDRILGFEIVTHSSESWKLSFVSEAVVFIDPCNSLKELLSQRRRWNNSAIAGRIWIFSQILSILSIENLPFDNKKSLLTSLFFQAYNIVISWFFPSVYVCLLANYYLQLKSVVNDSFWASYSVDFSFVLGDVLLALMFLICLRNNLTKKAENCLAIALVYQTLLLTSYNVILIITSRGSPIFILFNCIPCIATYLIASFYPNKKIVMSKDLFVFFLINPVLSLLTNIYSFLHFNDFSWGTKELTANSQDLQRGRMFQFSFLLFWLFSNCWPIFISLSFHSFSLVLEIIFFMTIFYFSFLLIGSIVGLIQLSEDI